MMTESGIEQLKRHEGLRLKAYRCPEGKLTIGYGHTGNVRQNDIITIETAIEFLMADIDRAETDARALVRNFDMLTPARQDALVNMAFNLGRGNTEKGTGLAGFKTFLRCIHACEWQAAAASLATSKWYKQVGNRAKDIQGMIKNG